VRQVELGTPAARPLSFEAVLSQARNRTTSDVRVAERTMVIVPPSTFPALDYSAWPTGGTKKLVISGESWPDPASAFAGSGSAGAASYIRTANYPAVQNQPCTFTITVTDNRVPDPQAAPPQEAVSYSIPAQLPLGIGQNKEGILSIASVSASGGWDVETGTLTVSLMPGQSTTVTATGTCLQNGLGKQILAENVGARVEQFEVEPGPQYMVVRRDEDASPRWMAVALDPQDSAYGYFYGEWGENGSKSVIIRVINVGLQRQFHTVSARNPGRKIGTELPGSFANKPLEELWLGGAPPTFVIVGRAAAVPGGLDWVLLAPVSRPNVLRLTGTFAAPWQKGTTKTVNTSDTAFPSVPVSNGLGDVRGVGSRSCVIVGTENQNGGYDWSLVEADLGWSGIIQGTFTAPWPKNQSKQITVNFGNGSEEITVSNPYASIAGVATKSCVVANLGTGGTDNWILIAAECS
jgi:hypothetical protein